MAGIEEFEQHRRYLGAVAYRMLGSVYDAQDAVQEAWLRWSEVDASAVHDPRAYLTTVVTRLCYDQLGSARARREAYYGEWLPEPLVDEEPSPQDRAERGEEISLALMALLERLSPAERAAFVLHDVFGVGFPEIAATLERSEAAVRQLASRARKQVKDGSPRTSVDRAAHHQAVRAFTDAVVKGDIIGLMKVLDPEIVWHADGGGIVRAAARPIEGADRVARLVLGLAAKFWDPAGTIAFVEVNGEPGLVVFHPDGTSGGVLGFTVADGLITAGYVVANPEKLRHLPPAPTG
ncbi:sigma-70 family RNA polymerase sigma factor [Actinospica durhamensis]|uniref:Sigma-70 family RNA polymerase sigma factor n=1 Tax=Actinospica durhamensis TaxID=1508375 RepID=A0A941EK19_9ACTN|nr:sigma-70 family RNA polymerase sigma factor [Actinospica durhamensis]MBR7832641.1 sigma-70 family RNA polymerase sigma factor [Actinospica durhamensis]